MQNKTFGDRINDFLMVSLLRMQVAIEVIIEPSIRQRIYNLRISKSAKEN